MQVVAMLPPRFRRFLSLHSYRHFLPIVPPLLQNLLKFPRELAEPDESKRSNAGAPALCRNVHSENRPRVVFAIGDEIVAVLPA